MLLLIATGVTGLVLAQPHLAMLITVLAAGYVLYLAYRIATAPVIAKDIATAKSPAFYSGFLLAIANPKAFAAIGAVYSSHMLLHDEFLLDAAAKIGALSVVIVCVISVWLLFGSAFSSLLTNPRKARIANVTFAIMLVGSVAAALIQG